MKVIITEAQEANLINNINEEDIMDKIGSKISRLSDTFKTVGREKASEVINKKIPDSIKKRFAHIDMGAKVYDKKTNTYKEKYGNLKKMATNLADLKKSGELGKSGDADKGVMEPPEDIVIAGADDMMHPLKFKYPIESGFGLRDAPKGFDGNKGNTDHKGVDFKVGSRSPVYSPLDGEVTDSRNAGGKCGGFIKINHGDIMTKYCHLSQMNVQKGVKVKKGQVIGLTGGAKGDPHPGTSTGAHLHYAILDNKGNPLDPTTVQTNLA